MCLGCSHQVDLAFGAFCSACRAAQGGAVPKSPAERRAERDAAYEELARRVAAVPDRDIDDPFASPFGGDIDRSGYRDRGKVR